MKAWNPELRAPDLHAWRRRTIGSALLLLVLTYWAATTRARPMALFLVQTQDVPVLFIASAAILLSCFWQPHWALPKRLPPRWILLFAAIGLVSLLAWGTYAVMGKFPLSRDAHMVVFDMAVFNSGRLAMPLAPEWRPYALALVPDFLLNESHPIGLVSGYMPVNAMLRVAFSKFADTAWYNPMLVLVGGAALLDIARRTFGPDDRACIVVLLIYCLSAQVLVNAMTFYAMTGHLALNLIWLAAFLRGGKLWNSVAILIGFFAVGLHQLAFHPVFVAPFLLWRLREGQWKLVLLYSVAYAAIVLWWACYPVIVSPLVAGAGGHGSRDNYLTQRIIPVLLNRDPRTFPLMILNLLRLFAWENLALVPLLVAAIPVAVRERGLARALFLGILLWIAFLTIVLPEQGRGWGYRYLNGYVGSFALLSGFGYRELEQRLGRRADGMVLLLSGLTLFAAIPLLLTAVYTFRHAHLEMQELIASQRTPFVLIDDTVSPSTDGMFADNASDHVRNMPDLSNRPLRFSSDNLDTNLLVNLCRKAPVTLITRRDMHRVGFILNVPEASPKFDALVSAAEQRVPRCFRNAIFPSATELREME